MQVKRKFIPPTEDPKDCSCGGARNEGTSIPRCSMVCGCCDGKWVSYYPPTSGEDAVASDDHWFKVK